MAVENPLTLALPELRRRTSVKWRTYAEDVLPLWVAEMDVHLADPVREALERAARDGDTGYTDGSTAYAGSLASFAADRWGWGGLDPERSSLVADVMTGVSEAIRLVTDPGGPVVVNPPVYPPFYAFVEKTGRRVETAPLAADGRLDLEVLATTFARLAGQRAAYLLCSPHNPTGVVHTPEELAAVAALADEHGVRVVVDEIHAPLVLPGAEFTPYLSVPGSGSAFVVLSASKAFNLAGAKAAVLFAGPDAEADLARLPEVVGHGPSHLGVLSHRAGLDHARDWLDALLAGLDAHRTLVGELLATHLPGVRWVPPQATYLAWLDLSALGLGEDPAEVLLERARVALHHGLPFGAGAGRARLNLATSPEILTEAVRRVAAAV